MVDTGLRAGGEPATGEVLDGRYRLEQHVGEGGMARVYRARDELLGRTVAVKIFRAVAAGGSDGHRAGSEVRLLAALNHHGLVTLFDAHLEGEGVSYLVTEFVEGRTLGERIDGGALPPAEVAAMAADLAEALHVVHAAGVVHRDVKPGNVLLAPSALPSRRFRPKLADFGIAHLVETTRVTTPGMVIGTVAYLAPEQARGADPAPPADIYSLGLVLIEALTGRRPFPQPVAADSVAARLTAPPQIPQSFGAGWTRLLTAMTAMRPEDRPIALEVAVAAQALTGRVPTGEVASEREPITALSPSEATTAVMPREAAAVLAREGTAVTAREGAVSAAEGTAVGAAERSAAPPVAATVTRPLDAAASRARGRTRRRGGVIALLAVVAVLAAAVTWAVVALVSSSAPSPITTPPAVEQQTNSPVAPAPAETSDGEQEGVEQTAPADDDGTATTPSDDGATATPPAGEGTVDDGNGNSGNGNGNSGNGNGNSGNGNGSGNGNNGNGNGSGNGNNGNGNG